MTTSRDSSEEGYIIDAESSAEMARLLDQDELITLQMGGLFPERSPQLEGVHDVLDVACGPGGWAMNVARSYPDIEVMGIDISERMIRYAQAHTQVRRLPNAHFQVMNVMEPLAFAPQSFDLVNARLLEAVMTPATWPVLLKEMARVCRPGGIIRLTEIEAPITSSPAFEKLNGIGLHTAHQAKRLYALGERTIGITSVFGRLLREAGCQNIQKKAHLFDFSAESEYRDGWIQNWHMAYQLARPFFLKMSLLTEEEFQTLIMQMTADMLSDGFCGIVYGMTAWGELPS
jgi:ubiquinone/menaquinone biosynthesis C-methylase UbiE